MYDQLEIMETDAAGVPYVAVGREAIWDFMEYLSWQRVRVTYGFEEDGCVVSFPHSDRTTVRRLLEEWRASHEPSATARAAEENPAFGIVSE